MLNAEQFNALKSRVESPNTSENDIRRDAIVLLAEVMRLTVLTKDLSAQSLAKLASVEGDMIQLEQDNARLRKNTESTYFERDACIGLLVRFAVSLGMKAGRAERRTEHGTEQHVVVDLPSGQVSWEYLQAEAHLFEWLPAYEGAFELQTVQDTYMRIMNPGLDATS